MADLSAGQRRLLHTWMPGALVLADLSWQQGDTVVLHVRGVDGEYIVKAGGPGNRHIRREIDGHEQAGTVWATTGRGARLLRADRAERILLLEYLPGTLVVGTASALDPAVHRRAGGLLRRFHDQDERASGGSDAAATRRAIAWLDSDHAIDSEAEARLRVALAVIPAIEAPLVPTHGDWQPRNWLVEGGEVRVIDFGRFAYRPRATDFVRMAAQEWGEDPACESAFVEGYGYDPRDPEHWRLMLLREAIGTAVWAFQVGDREFEQQGHRMIASALAGLRQPARRAPITSSAGSDNQLAGLR